MQPPILQMQQHTMAAQAFLRARNRFFFFLHASSISEALFSLCAGVVCVCVCRHLFPIHPSPKAELIHRCSGKAGTQHTSSPRSSAPRSLSHTFTHTVPWQAHHRLSFPPPPLPQPYPPVREHHPQPRTHLSGYCWGNWPLTPPLGNRCRRRQKCAAYSLLHWRKRSPVPSIDLIFPPLCSL